MKGRGHHVIASFQVPNRVLKKLLRVSADEILEALVDKHLGSQMAGLLGMNLHVANALAALYLALGRMWLVWRRTPSALLLMRNAGKICMPHLVCQASRSARWAVRRA